MASGSATGRMIRFKAPRSGQMSPVARFYLINERLILGGVMLIVVLLAWEGLERGWWASLLEPMAGASAERLRLKPIFISSPTLVLQAAYRMFFVTGEMWRDLAGARWAIRSDLLAPSLPGSLWAL